MWVWCGKSGYDFGIGKSVYSIRSREVLMCSERYAEDMPFLLPKTQLPPMRSDFSKQSKGIPRWRSAFAAAIPDEPAPMTQTDGNCWLMGSLLRKLTQASPYQGSPPPPAGVHARGARPP